MPFRFAQPLASLSRSATSAVKTLRFRLMVWNAGLVLAAALAAFIGVREGLRQTLISGMDEVLIADAREVSLDVGDLHTTAADLRAAAQMKGSSPAVLLLQALNRKESVHQHNGWFVELMDGDERRLWASDLTPNLGPRDAVRSELVPVSWSGYRIVEENQTTARGRPLRIRVGAPMDFINRDISSIDALAGRGVALLLVAAPLAGYWLAGRAVRPLAAIIKTTAGLRPNRMEERLPTGQTDDELDQLSRTVNQFLDRIAAYLSQSNDLLANSAHELRTPLAAIRSSVEVALAGDRTPREYEELLTEVIDECVSLERLVNQLLLLSETDSERLRSRSEPVGFSTLVESLRRNVQRGRRGATDRAGKRDRARDRSGRFRTPLAASRQQPLGQRAQIQRSGGNGPRGTVSPVARLGRAPRAGHRLRNSGGRLAAYL